jgi:DNA-binding FadR family transcriptional regulator
MFANLDTAIAETLTGRTKLGLMPDRPNEEALQWHVALADAILGGDPGAARENMRSIMHQAINEMGPTWADAARVFLPTDPSAA